jgi:hypothetical protein
MRPNITANDLDIYIGKENIKDRNQLRGLLYYLERRTHKYVTPQNLKSSIIYRVTLSMR